MATVPSGAAFGEVNVRCDVHGCRVTRKLVLPRTSCQRTCCREPVVAAVCERQDKYSPPCSAMTLVTLPGVTDAATMLKISFWRYLAVNRTTLFAALACALLVFSMLGCGSTKKLQSIQLSTSSESETSTSGLSLNGISSNIQLYAWANYSNGKSVLIHGDELPGRLFSIRSITQDAYGNVSAAAASGCPVERDRLGDSCRSCLLHLGRCCGGYSGKSDANPLLGGKRHLRCYGYLSRDGYSRPSRSRSLTQGGRRFSVLRPGRGQPKQSRADVCGPSSTPVS